MHSVEQSTRVTRNKLEIGRWNGPVTNTQTIQHIKQVKGKRCDTRET